jgi:hypothetical protein
MWLSGEAMNGNGRAHLSKALPASPQQGWTQAPPIAMVKI